MPLRGDPQAALQSIKVLCKTVGDCAIVGAGTVLTKDQVHEVANCGTGLLVVSPNLAMEVVAETARSQLLSVPGVFSPTEAYQAINAGAAALKWFPTDGMSPKTFKAMRDVLRAIGDYPPGQSGIDGAGWKIIKREPAYVYAQYESRRHYCTAQLLYGSTTYY